MHRTVRLLTDKEMDKFLALREESNIKAARYMKSIENDLFEVTEDKYDYSGKSKTISLKP